MYQIHNIVKQKEFEDMETDILNLVCVNDRKQTLEFMKRIKGTIFAETSIEKEVLFCKECEKKVNGYLEQATDLKRDIDE